MLKTLKMSNSKMRVQDFKLSDAGGHPNKVSFKCVLFTVDQPSDGSPSGAGGKLIRISSSVCDQYLQTFVGMALNIDYATGMADHEPRFKVAVIDKAYRSMDGCAWVEGYIYGKDFPDVVATIRYYNGLAAEYNWSEYKFGASLEMEASVQNATDMENVLDVMEFCGTGAAILFADAAAYKTTSFAAKNNKPNKEDVEMTPEEIKAMQDAMKAIQDGMNSITASVQSVVKEVVSIKEEITTIKASDEKTKQKTAEEQAVADLKAAKDEAETLKQELAELKANGLATAEPGRKTISAAQLLSKYGSQLPDGEGTDHASFCAAVDNMKLDASQSIALKMKHREISAAQV
ncbi:3-oxoacyl-ACP reductase [Paenibacillus odorifer]|uniref:3-oxoacyl-ACP reductase n=1 Tax=Paenibacillus odorifer TaxID=189426 RepID=UPI00096E468C|nr:3-oxoacyl-ACP reductase [Paenibacillus odorifer]OME55127.1 3-oxoacyl-ACP reductase [Paenibacillus odorifer]